MLEYTYNKKLQIAFQNLMEDYRRDAWSGIYKLFSSYRDVLPWIYRDKRRYNFENVGISCPADVSDFLHQFGKKYKAYIRQHAVDFEAQSKKELIETVSILFRNELEKQQLYDADVIDALRAIYPDYTLFARDLLYYPYQVCNIIFVYNEKYALACLDMILNICSKIKETLKARALFHEDCYDFVKAVRRISNYRDDNNVRLVHFANITPDKDSLLRHAFEETLSRYDNRTQSSIVKGEIDYLEFMCFLKNEKELFRLPRVGIERFQQLKKLLADFEPIYHKILFDNTDNVRYNLCKHQFHFLSNDDVEFVSQFYGKHHHYPMFYILCRYFNTTTNNNAKIFASYCGLGDEATLAAARSKLSRERIRQIIGIKSFADQDYKNVMNPQWWQPYNLSFTGVLTPKMSQFKNISRREHLSISFNTYACLVNLFQDSRVLHFTTRYTDIGIGKISAYINGNQPFHTCIYDAKYLNFNFFSAFEDFDIMVRKFRKNTDKISLRPFVSNPKYWREGKVISADSVEHFLYVFECIIKDFWGLCVQDHYVQLPANRIDYAEIFYNIIKDNGKGMFVKDIFARYKQLYPRSKYKTPLQIKPYLFKDERLINIGKTTIYSLVEWGVFPGSLFDLVIDVVAQSDSPVCVRDLISQVLERRPSSTKRSVENVIYLCVKDGRLVRVGKALIDIP